MGDPPRMPGFEFRYRPNGDPPTVRRLPLNSNGHLAKGDFLSYRSESGEVRLAGTGDADLLGALLKTEIREGKPDVVEVITDGDAVYGVDDVGARLTAEFLDIDGLTGVQGVETGPNDDFTAVAESAGNQETLVRISIPATHQFPSEEPATAEMRPAAGKLNAAMARAVVAILTKYVGRGPTKAQAFYRNNVVVLVLEDTMTKGEKSLVAAGRAHTVLTMRKELQLTMREEMVSAIEQLTGGKVAAFMSDNHVEPAMAVEVFVLDQPVAPDDAAPTA